MSRIGKKPIPVPSGVKIAHDAKTRTIDVEGSKGSLSWSWRPEVDVAWDEGEREITCTIPESKTGVGQMRAYWGTTRACIANMIHGVSEGYTKKLEVVGVGWNARPKGKSIELNIGYCHPIVLEPPAGVEYAIENQIITVTGADKQAVGQFAADIRAKRPPEPYNGKGIKYQNEIIIRKQGKVFGA